MFPAPVDGSTFCSPLLVLDVVVVVGVVMLLCNILAMSRMFCNRLSYGHSMSCSCVVLFVCAVVMVFVVVLCLPEHGTLCSLMLALFLPLYLLCRWLGVDVC